MSLNGTKEEQLQMTKEIISGIYIISHAAASISMPRVSVQSSQQLFSKKPPLHLKVMTRDDRGNESRG